MGVQWPHIVRYCDATGAIPHIARYRFREVGTWHSPTMVRYPPLCYLVSHRHICAISHFATYRAGHLNMGFRTEIRTRLRLTFPRAKLRRRIAMTRAEVWAKNWAKFWAKFSGHFRVSFAVQSDPPRFLQKFLLIYHSMSCQESCG